MNSHSPTELLDRLSCTIDRKVGIIKYLSIDRASPGEPDFHYATAVLAEVTRVYPDAVFSPYAGGAALDRNSASLKAIGEGLERYCAFLIPQENVITASFETLPDAALDPMKLPLCSMREFSNKLNYLHRPSRSIATRWFKGVSIVMGGEIFVPANLIWMSQFFASEQERWFLPISTGLAFGNSVDDATLRAACEVIERDAFTVFWYHQLPLKRLRLDGVLPASIQERYKRIRNANLLPMVFQLPNEFGMPAFFLILLSESRKIPVLSVAAAADCDPTRAVTRLLDEGVATRRYCLYRLRSGHRPKDVIANPWAARSLEDHLFAYIQPAALRHFDFLTSQPETVSLESVEPFARSNENALDKLKAQCSALDQETIVVDITTRDLKDLGFSVVRVIMPGLEPLSQDHNIRFLGRSRLYELPNKFGFTTDCRTENDITPLPHPFA